mgnify:CR=1 FL=1
MHRLVVATTNSGKLREYLELLATGPLAAQVVALWPGHPELGGRVMAEVPEVSHDLAENAQAKARAAADFFGRVAVADDTGLYVQALGGAPGPRAARYGGENATDEARIRRLLGELEGVPPGRRTAWFRCALAVAVPVGHGGPWDGRTRVFWGECPGEVTLAPRGTGGFGYDPVFEVAGLGRTFAELDLSQKNRLSHRARAWRQAEGFLALLLGALSAGGEGGGRCG